MPRIKKTIEGSLVEYACDCGKGVYRLTQNQPICSDYYHSWEHACSHCGDVAIFNVAYPAVEFDSHIFVLKKSTPAPKGPAQFGDFLVEGITRVSPMNSDCSLGIFKFVN